MKIIKIIILFLFFATSIFSNIFWEKKNFSIDVVENFKGNNTNKIRKYKMNYNNGVMKLEITYPELNKGELYTITSKEKTIYYPSLKQTVTQKLKKDEKTMLTIFKMISELKEKKTQVKNGNKFVFENKLLLSIQNKNYTVNFNDYSKVGEYSYPKKTTIKSGETQVIYNFSNLR